MLTIYPKLVEFNSTMSKQKAKSVRMKMTLGEKKKVIQLLKHHEKFYNEYKDEYYYQHMDRIGKDSVSYTTDQIIKDIHIKLRDWEHKPSNDIFESYVLRHNQIVLDTAERLNKKEGADIAEDYIDSFFINYSNALPPSYKQPPEGYEQGLFV